MATPRVFISSTCYDFAEIRDGLATFFGSLGFDVTLSERGDVFFHPELHTHDSCVRETSNCQLFVLIIGGRFGGRYQSDPTKSITNAEFSAAKQNKTPVFAFVKSSVLADHNLWQKNKTKKFADEIEYPSIDNSEHAVNIFEFIDEVKDSSTNNGFHGFTYARDLQDILRKQIAGMLFDFLKERTIEKRLDETNAAVENLSNVSNKIEDLVKRIYTNIDGNSADVIAGIDRRSKAESFFQTVARLANDEKFLSSSSDIDTPYLWLEDFLADAGFFEIRQENTGSTTREALFSSIDNRQLLVLDETASKREKQVYADLSEGFAEYLSLPREDRLEVLQRYVYVPRARKALQSDESSSTSSDPESSKSPLPHNVLN